MTEGIAVADAGPLIHLDEVGLNACLGLFEAVLVPREVAAELRLLPDGPGNQALRCCTVAPSVSGDAPLQLGTLSQADRAALMMAKGRGALLLTDDLELRDTAKLAGVRVVGTIGILVRAGRTGVVPTREAARSLDALLSDSTLFITPRLIEQAKAALELP